MVFSIADECLSISLFDNRILHFDNNPQRIFLNETKLTNLKSMFMKRNNLNYFRRFKIILYLWIVLLVTTFNLASFPVFGNIPDRNDENGVEVVTGKLISPDGSPLSEVTVTVKETLISAVTGENGLFTVTVKSATPTLTISKEGYQTQELTTDGKNETIVVLRPDKYVDLLFARQKQDQITEAVSSISGNELKNLPGVNRNNVLGGRFTGLTVQQNNGEPDLKAVHCISAR
jgi:hypothetical protein